MTDPQSDAQEQDANGAGGSQPEQGKHSPDQAQVGTTDGDGDNG